MIRRSELEKEVNALFDDLKENDYIIPTVRMILKPTFSFLKPFYLTVFIVSIIGWFIHSPFDFLMLLTIAVFDAIGIFVVTFASSLFMYNANLLLLCLSDEFKKRSYLCNKWYRLIDKAQRLCTIGGILATLPFLFFINWGASVPLWSWFVMVFITGVSMNAIFHPYLTPEIVNFISKVREGSVVNFGENKD